MSARRTLAEKFWTKVTAGEADDCWEWEGARSPKEYGIVAIGRTSTTGQRLSWMVHHGDIPDGLVVRHRCDNPPCVNPNHLELGTRADNTHDAMERSEAWKHRPCGAWRVLDVDAASIRARYAQGESQQSIADSLGISQSSVSQIVRQVGHYSPIIM